MSNKKIFGNGLQLLNEPFELAQLASDPGSPSNGMMYYNTTSNKIRQYANGAWSDIASGSVSLTGQALNQNEIIVGNGSNVSAAVNTASVGDIQADSSTGLNIKTGVIVNADINSSAAIAYSKLNLSNSILNADINSSAAIAYSKLAALTANRALQSDGSGVVSASSVTATELGYLSGVTSAIQTQINNVTSLIQNFEWQPSALSRSVTPPGSPSTGDRYLIDLSLGTPTGAWTGRGDDIAEWNGSSWVFTTPTLGAYIGIDDESDGLYLYGGASWDKKYFEATTASTGLVKVGFDIRLDASAAGAGLGFSSGVLSVNVDDSTIEIATDTIRVKDSGITAAKIAAAVAGDGIAGGAGTALSVDHDGEGLTFVANQLALELDGSTLSKSASGIKVAAGGITNTEVNASAAIALSKLAALTASRALVSDGSGIISVATTTATEIGYVNGVTSAIQTQLNGKANTALSNLASVAINTTLVSDTNNTDDLGTDSIEWKDAWVHRIVHNDSSNPDLTIQTSGNNGNIINISHGTGNHDIRATSIRRSESGASTNYLEERYYDALTLAANTSSPTEISSSLSFAMASYRSAHISYEIIEATTNKVRTGILYVVCDGTNAYSSDEYMQTAQLGSAAGLSLSVDVSGGNVRILFNNTNASNSCTLRADRKLFRV